MIGTVLALLSAAVSGIAVVLVGKYAKESNALGVSIVVSLIGLFVVWPFAVVLTDFSKVSLEGILLFAAGGVMTPGLVRLFYYSGLKKLGPSVNSSVFSVYPLYGALFAVLFLGESLTLTNWLGVVAIALGIVLVELSCRNSSCSNTALKDWGFPLVGGLTLGVSAVLRKVALNISDSPLLGVAVAYCFAFIPFLVILGLRRGMRSEISIRRDLKRFWLAGSGLAGAWILSFYALSLDSVGVVTPLLSIEPLFVVLFVLLYMRGQDHLSLRLAASIVLTVLGVALVVT